MYDCRTLFAANAVNGTKGGNKASYLSQLVQTSVEYAAMPSQLTPPASPSFLSSNVKIFHRTFSSRRQSILE